MRSHRDSVFAILLVSAFLCIGLANTLTHEMWRDELQSWMIAKDSTSIENLFWNKRYEGHPSLWHICLYVLSRFTHQPITMQFFHLMVATATVYIFTRFSPFTRLQKILFVFGFFPLYEYGTISRHYAMSVLFIFCLCALLRNPNRNYIIMSCILFLIAQTIIFAVIIAIAFGATFFFGYIADRDFRKSLSARKTEILIGISIYILGIVSSVLQCIPPADVGAYSGWKTNIDICYLLQSISAVCRSYLLVNRNILPCAAFNAVVSIFLLSFWLLVFYRKPVVLLLYSLGTTGLLAFGYLKATIGIRHHGYLFILLIVCLWLSDYNRDREPKHRLISNFSTFCNKYRVSFITAILLIHCLSGIAASGRDWLQPYSAGKQTAKFINDKHISGMLMAGDWDYVASVVAGYLDRKIYYPRTDRFGSFILWDKRWGDEKLKNRSSSEILQKIEELATQKKQDVLLIMNYKLNISEYPIVEIEAFNKSIKTDEVCYLYIYKHDDPIKQIR